MSTFRLFERFGVELEYMIVDADSLSVKPIADEFMRSVSGEYTNSIERGPITWSNELVNHVIELKTTDPVRTLEGVHEAFQSEVRYINGLLEPFNARLMPTAMHPWMDPHTEMRLWTHENNDIYDAFNRIFDCRGHGWANLQSVHLNLPFGNEDEFARLHAAIRVLLPIMPAIAASSPIVESVSTGLVDNRLDVYRSNCARIPSVTGRIIPEPVFTFDAYRRDILGRMYTDIAPYDSDGTLQDEWLNARGAITRFERNTIEIRVLDVQECPHADLAIVSVIVAALKALIDERFAPLEVLQRWEIDPLYRILLGTIREGELFEICDKTYLEFWGMNSERTSAGAIWSHILDGVEGDIQPGFQTYLKKTILDRGTLARRILRMLPGSMTADDLIKSYTKLCDCLDAGVAL